MIKKLVKLLEGQRIRIKGTRQYRWKRPALFWKLADKFASWYLYPKVKPDPRSQFDYE